MPNCFSLAVNPSCTVTEENFLLAIPFPQGQGKVYDVFLQDTTDHSSCVNITDENGDQVPFDEWDNVLMFLNIKSN